MLNNGMGYYYEQDFTVINPYTSNQAVFRNSNNGSVPNSGDDTNMSRANGNQPLLLELDKASYGKREAIKLNLTSLGAKEGYGNYVISVRKIDELKGGKKPTVLDYQKIYPEVKPIPNRVLPNCGEN
ncbi:hypothetical protein NYZ99_08035 [Maribacter litopenaei]|uniref:Uncharacterized protein n=1 Tax=Maribacter litopenaei TaxID=2976127 RepID=A0ABY5YCZ2_9FLAO|nr:hypothetical protein [Maribacter litopenaei]UWX56192.1 hypothetical protein NYZ99_08035 [Maribacter litopenaei]